ncbi:MAG: hypothetical protein HYX92_20270 [Chloroflexi bacterium]|nr:hypothetical protein [Chloroflexota bacterium]
MTEIVYALVTLTALACALLLLRAYSQNGERLLMWAGLCFAGLTLNNLLVLVDVVVLPQVSLYLLRQVVGLISMAVLVYGLVFETR